MTICLAEMVPLVRLLLCTTNKCKPQLNDNCTERQQQQIIPFLLSLLLLAHFMFVAWTTTTTTTMRDTFSICRHQKSNRIIIGAYIQTNHSTREKKKTNLLSSSATNSSVNKQQQLVLLHFIGSTFWAQISKQNSLKNKRKERKKKKKRWDSICSRWFLIHCFILPLLWRPLDE